MQKEEKRKTEQNGKFNEILAPILHIMRPFHLFLKEEKTQLSGEEEKNRTDLLHRHFLSLLLRFEFQQ